MLKVYLALIPAVVASLDGCVINGKFLSSDETLTSHHKPPAVDWHPTQSSCRQATCSMYGASKEQKCQAPCITQGCSIPSTMVEGKCCPTEIEGDKSEPEFWKGNGLNVCTKPNKGILISNVTNADIDMKVINECFRGCYEHGEGCCEFVWGQWKSAPQYCVLYPGGVFSQTSHRRDYYAATEVQKGPDCLLTTSQDYLNGTATGEWLLDGQTASYANPDTCAIQTCKKGIIVETPEKCPDVDKEPCDGTWAKKHKSCCSICIPKDAEVKHFTVPQMEHAR